MASPHTSHIDPETSLPMHNANHSFSLFPRLPVEIRLKIWKAASFLIRNVEIRLRLAPRRAIQGAKTNFIRSDYISNQPPPAILHTSREARSEGLRYYRLDFGVTMEDLLERWHSRERNPRGFRPEPTEAVLNAMKMRLRSAMIYFNWQADRLCIGDLRPWDIYPRCRRNNLRFLAFNVFHSNASHGYPWSSKLEEIIIFNDKMWYKKKIPIARNSARFVDLIPGKQRVSWERLELPLRQVEDQFTARTRSRGLGHDTEVPEFMPVVRACKIERTI